MFQTATFPAAVIPSESTENTIIDSQKVSVNIWTNSVCPNGAWNLCQICFIVTLLVNCLDKELMAYKPLFKYFIQVLSFVPLVHITQTATRVGPNFTLHSHNLIQNFLTSANQLKIDAKINAATDNWRVLNKERKTWY